jgi:hypothetical protein
VLDTVPLAGGGVAAAQRRPVALASAVSLSSPTSPPLPSGAFRKSPAAATQNKDGSTAGSSMAAMASSRTGSHGH